MAEPLKPTVEDVANVQFLTGSKYEGAWNKSVHTMEGFGTYRFPDGGEYRGRFVSGKFHGFGHIKLAQPYRFTIKGEFCDGKLVNIEDMWFNDGLHVQGSFEEGNFLCDDWEYLTPQDRRYQTELFYGQQPVGPTSYLTSTLQSRHIPQNCFDAEEGIYNAETGWLTERPPPFSRSVYVSCPREKAWIERHCRAAHRTNIKEPLPSVCRQIVANNVSNEKAQLKNIIIYAPKKHSAREETYANMCQDPPKAEEPTADVLFPTDRPRAQQLTEEELCIRKKFCKEQKRVDSFTRMWKSSRPGERLPTLDRVRQWTSSSDPLNVDSGASQTLTRSFSENSIIKKVEGFYDNAYWMAQKKATDNLYVVQSNMKRPTSFVDINLSVFHL
ncbi:hypothetical protein KR222_002592 [Zaprionus bogoriensis]|nr:hypothetical protein KR222_002592 [Zaprionus bogoriensis]